MLFDRRPSISTVLEQVTRAALLDSLLCLEAVLGFLAARDVAAVTHQQVDAVEEEEGDRDDAEGDAQDDDQHV